MLYIVLLLRIGTIPWLPGAGGPAVTHDWPASDVAEDFLDRLQANLFPPLLVHA